MSIYLLNISVDTADPNPEHLPEDLSINDQESFIELVVEQVLGYEDAFKEYDDIDTEEHNKKTNIKIDLTNHFITEVALSINFSETGRQYFLNYTDFLASGCQQLDFPPPKI